MGREDVTVSIVDKMMDLSSQGRTILPAGNERVEGADRVAETSGSASVELDAVKKMAEILGGSLQQISTKKHR